jgi:hypothetical protein
MRVARGVGGFKVTMPRVLAAGLGAALQAADVATEFGTEAAQALLDRHRALTRQVERGYHGAARRGDQAFDEAVTEAARRLNQAADAAAAWADRIIIRRVAEAMTPYLIDELVPEVIDGVLPKIRADVIPAVIEDLAGDERVRMMVAQQSQGMLAWSVAEVRRTCADGDDRAETALRRILGRRDTRA